MCALHMLPQHTHQQAYSAFLATDFHFKWLFSGCFQAKYIPLRARWFFFFFLFLNHAFNISIKSNERYGRRAHASLACVAVLTHEFDSIYSILRPRCMKRRVCSYGGRPLAGLLMGYGPRLHLFRWISLLGSARQHHVRGCGGEVMGRQWSERQLRSSPISRILFQ